MLKMPLWVLASAFLCFSAGICAAEGIDLFTRIDIPLLKIVVGTNAIQELWRSPRSYVTAATVTEGSETFLGVGVHLKGGAGSGQPLSRKPSLSLHFGKYQKGQRFHGLKHLQLNNCAQDPTYLNEILSSEVFLAAGIPCPRCTHVLVSLNGKDLGLYVLREGVDQDFLARSFGSARGNAFQGTYGIDVDGKLANTVKQSGPSLNSDDLHCVLSMSDPESRFQALRDFVDWEAFVLFMAAEVITTHGDGYTLGLNNYRFFVPQIQDPAGDWKAGPLHMVPSGMDQMLSSPGLPAFPFVGSKLGRSVLASPTGRALYTEAFGRVFGSSLFPVELELREAELA